MPKSIHISLVKTICQARLEAGNKKLKNSFKSLWMEWWTNTEAQFWFDGCKLNPMAFLNRWTTTKKTTKCHQHLVSCNVCSCLFNQAPLDRVFAEQHARNSATSGDVAGWPVRSCIISRFSLFFLYPRCFPLTSLTIEYAGETRFLAPTYPSSFFVVNIMENGKLRLTTGYFKEC